MSEYRNHSGCHTMLDHYPKYVVEMTAEGLHPKSEVAAELAYRDMQLDALRELVRELEKRLAEAKRDARNHMRLDRGHICNARKALQGIMDKCGHMIHLIAKAKEVTG